MLLTWPRNVDSSGSCPARRTCGARHCSAAASRLAGAADPPRGGRRAGRLPNQLEPLHQDSRGAPPGRPDGRARATGSGGPRQRQCRRPRPPCTAAGRRTSSGLRDRGRGFLLLVDRCPAAGVAHRDVAAEPGAAGRIPPAGGVALDGLLQIGRARRQDARGRALDDGRCRHGQEDRCEQTVAPQRLRATPLARLGARRRSTA